MSVFLDDVKDDRDDGPLIEFVSLELNHFRTVAKDNQPKSPVMILPPGSNYNRSDRLAIDASLGSRPTALSKEEFRALKLHPVWTIYWDDEEALKVSWSKDKEHHIEIDELSSSPLKIANQKLFGKSFGHVVVVTTEPGGDSNQHKVSVEAVEGEDRNGDPIKSNKYEYMVMGAW
jgi:hypothetical protein